MKTWVIGIGVFLLWSAGSTYWYVCKVKGLCWEAAAVELAEGNVGNGLAPADSNNDPSTDAIASNEGSVVDTIPQPPIATETIPALLQTPYTVLFVFAGGPMPDDPKAFEAYLDELAAYLKAHPSQKAVLRGYTDDTAARENNIKLAGRRCDVIAKRLTERGVAESQIISEPLGEVDPVASNDTEAGRRLNRRVVISLQQ